MDDLSQYKELYIQTSRDYLKSLNAALLKLEKTTTNKEAIEEIFRSAHSLKSQSAAMGYQSTGFLCHTIEDVFYEIKQGNIKLTSEIADILFKSLDVLINSINTIEKENKEPDLSLQAETLKKASGVSTFGAGKSKKKDSDSSTAHATPKVQVVTQPTIQSIVQPTIAPELVTINTIAVKVEILDELMSGLEGMLIERLKLKEIISNASKESGSELKNYFRSTEKILDFLQYQIMRARAVPVSLVFDHFPRAVRDLARAENKEVEFIMNGGDLALDRTIVDRLDEPLIHLLRNAISHGIKEKGTIIISAERQRDYAEISIKDDGQGINWTLLAEKSGTPITDANPKVLKELLFSGISTSETVTEISGRGVGLQAVKKMIDNFGGKIDVVSEPGKGTTFNIKLPLTLAIAKALIVKIGEGEYAIPTLGIEQIVSIPQKAVKKIAGQEAFILDEMEVPLIRMSQKLGEELDKKTTRPKAQDIIAVIVGENTERSGLIVDAVIETIDIVLKPVPAAFHDIRMFTGVTILNNGRTALVINPAIFM